MMIASPIALASCWKSMAVCMGAPPKKKPGFESNAAPSEAPHPHIGARILARVTPLNCLDFA
jgi:hypothetical protein